MNNKQIEKINQLLRKQIIQKYGVLGVGLFVVGSVAYVGTLIQNASHAAAVPPTLSVQSSGSQTVGQYLKLDVYEDSGTVMVNAVQLSIQYDSTKLVPSTDTVGHPFLTDGTVFTETASTDTSSAGVIRVARYVPKDETGTYQNVSGKNLVESIYFKVKAPTAAGSPTQITFQRNNYTSLTAAADGSNLMLQAGAVYNEPSYVLTNPAPTINATAGISPASATDAGGTPVTIAGTGFAAGATVSVGGGTAITPTSISATSIVFTTPAHAPGAVDVSVTNPDGQTVTATRGFTYLSQPTVVSISPTNGLTSSTTTVVITGRDFMTGPTVKFGSTTLSAANVTFNSSTQITVTAPAQSAGSVPVQVINTDGQASNTSVTFLYKLPNLSVVSLSKTSGSVAGGTQVVITGTNFAGISGANGVTFGGVAATSYSVDSTTQITAYTPAHAAGTVSVAVTNSSNTSTLANAFTYLAAAPTISQVTAAGGSVNGGAIFGGTAYGGTIVTINGTGFATGATVSFGGKASTLVTYISATQLTAIAPAHTAGTVDVVVTNSDAQTVTATGSYIYLGLGDINNDSRVNALDLSVLMARQGQNYAPADVDGNNLVDDGDFPILIGRWTW